MVATETILGGLLSSFIGGVGAVEDRYWRHKKKKEQHWYNRTERIAQRVLRHDYNDWTGPKPLYARGTCAGIHSELANHISKAPPLIDESVLRIADQLVSQYQLVKQLSEVDVQKGSE